MKILPNLLALAGLGLSLGISLGTGGESARAEAPHETEASRARVAQDEYTAGRARAESFHARGSYTKALEVYREIAEAAPDEAEQRWVAFRLADCAWRAAAKTNEADTTTLDRARKELEELATDPEHVEDRNLVWAEANESLGAYFWTRRRSTDWGNGWPRYQKALSWWAASSDLEVARRRYLDLVFEVGLPPWENSPWNRGNYAASIPRDVLGNAAKIALAEEDVAAANYLLGLHYARQGHNLAFKGRAEEALRRVIALGRDVEWYDDALYQLAVHLQNQGQAVRGESGNWEWRPDYVGAVALYRRIVREYRKGETHWYDQAVSSIEQITQPNVWVSVSHFFLPGSEVTYDLSWRNVAEVDLTLYRTDLTEHVSVGRDGNGDWLNSIPLNRLERFRSWKHVTEDDGKHRPGNSQETLEEKLPVGAYVLEARAGGERARALVLVSDLALTTKASGDELLAWVTDVETGAPIPEAKLALTRWHHDGNEWRLRTEEAVTAADGTYLFEFGPTAQYTQFFVAAASGDRQAYAQSNANASLTPSQEWRIYAYTDRSTYRPGHEVSWKFFARRYDGRSYATPENAKLRWFVTDPRGADWKEGECTLDEFGGAFGALETEAEMVLGEYRIRFVDERGHHVGQANLFRLEEYELPEFEVSVSTARDDDGSPKRFVLGDEVEAEIQADYYFGGAVANANVEVYVYQKPFWFRFPTEREFPWLYQDQNQNRWWGGNGNQVSHQILRTDENGRAIFTFETPFEVYQDYEYTIEARVTDASRREILGRGTVRATRNEYFVEIKPQHAIHRPGADVELDLRARDANGNPVVATGAVQVTREEWIVRWRDPAGKLVGERDLPRPLPSGWELVSRGYEKEVVAEVTLTTSAEGEAAWRFTPTRPGTYAINWKSVDARDSDVTATAQVFVADEATRELGYYSGGVEILVDQDTLAVGEDAVFLLTAPASGLWVLVTVEGDDLQHHEVVRLDGSVKLMRIPMTEAHVPNVWLGAMAFAGGEAFTDMVELVVPPTRNFLDVEVTHAAEAVEPGSEAEVAILVRDHSGEPTSAQLSVAVVDESLAYVQGDYAGDPRRFFYGQRRQLRVSTYGSYYHGTYRDFAKKDGRVVLRDEEEGGFYDDDFSGGKEKKGERMRQDAPGRSASKMRAAEPASEAMFSTANAPAVGALGYAGADEADAMGGQGPLGEEPNVRVRSDFRETALWEPDVVTGADGRATVKLKYPDSTTRWKTTVRAIDRGTRVGSGEAQTRTRQPLIARLQAPRFFVVGDQVTVSANLNNNTDADMRLRATLEVEGIALLGRVVDGDLEPSAAQGLVVPAGDQIRVDWRVVAREPGEAKFVLRAIGAETGDAVERSFPVYAHGIEAFLATSGKFEGEELSFSLDLPAARGAGSTSVRVQVTPSIAVTMLDALPYLVDYPYGCTEQTLSRFLPSTIVAKTLRGFGLSPEDAMARVFGGIEPDFAHATQPKGKRPLDRLDDMTERGLARLYDFQHSDGGWAWWKTGESDHFMTAYVVWGLSLARDSGLDVRAGVLERGARYLALELVEEEWNVDLAAWMLHALAVQGGETGDTKTGALVERGFRDLLRRRDGLNAYGRALVALAAHELGHADEARLLIENLIDGVVIDDSTDTSIVQRGAQSGQPYALRTAHWGNDGISHRWSEGSVEATAFALRALVAVDPEHELVEPVANWLVQNRRGAQWSNTRDTAITVLALNDYLVATKQLSSEVAYRVEVNGERIASVAFSAAELLRAPSEFDVPARLIRDGVNTIRIVKSKGDGPLYFAAHATFFSQEEPIPARGNQVFVRRDYYKLVGRPTLLQGFVHDRVLLGDGDSVRSGERIQVVLTIEAKNDLEYMLFEDLKPAGFEAVEVRSGSPLSVRELKRGGLEERQETQRGPGAQRGEWSGSPYTGRTRGVHQELRDRQIALFIDRMADGFWEITYELRAETPGSFHALPLLGHAMYVPEIRANGAETRVQVLDR